jgi:hypothetical protein
MQQGKFFLLQVIVNYNIPQFLTYPYVLQTKDNVDYTWQWRTEGGGLGFNPPPPRPPRGAAKNSPTPTPKF